MNNCRSPVGERQFCKSGNGIPKLTCIFCKCKEHDFRRSAFHRNRNGFPEHVITGHASFAVDIYFLRAACYCPRLKFILSGPRVSRRPAKADPRVLFSPASYFPRVSFSRAGCIDMIDIGMI